MSEHRVIERVIAALEAGADRIIIKKVCTKNIWLWQIGWNHG
jgi:hypothetical protein